MNYIMTVINPDALKKLSDICAQLEIPMSVALHGRGTAIESMRDLLGIDSTEKWIVFSVAGEEKTKEYMNSCAARCISACPVTASHGLCP